MFNHQRLPSVTLTPRMTKDGRVYDTPDGTFYSVTTTIGKSFDSKYLDEWRDRIGHEAAERISTQAKNRGTDVHRIFENYILGSDEWRKSSPVNKSLFMKVKPFIDKNLTTVYGIEHQLYSKQLKAAGTADLIGEWNSKFTAVSDYKTSRRFLKEDGDTLLKYKLQVTAYSMMIKELYELEVPFGMIIILVQDEKDAQIVQFRTSKYIDKVKKIFN